jgi:hypothetical protein
VQILRPLSPRRGGMTLGSTKGRTGPSLVEETATLRRSCRDRSRGGLVLGVNEQSSSVWTDEETAEASWEESSLPDAAFASWLGYGGYLAV